MPAVTSTMTCNYQAPTSAAVVNRLVLTQMLTCGVLGWAIFALAVDRWLATENIPEPSRTEAVAQQVSGPSPGTISLKSAQFPGSDRNKTR